MQLDRSIFKTYDIRGVAGKNLTPEVTHAVGLVLAAKAREKGVDTFCVARDGRISGPELTVALIKGLVEGGMHVKNIGSVPTPVLYFATKYLQTGTGVAVTGSHNPPQDNGMKMMIAGETLFGPEIAAIGEAIAKGEAKPASVAGSVQEVDVREAYIQKIVSDVHLARPMTVAIDTGNGVSGPMARELFTRLGCKIHELFFEVDGHFPNHQPDPSKPANLQDLLRAVKETDAEVGLAFDGDADRLGVVTRTGHIIFPDRMMMLFSEEILKNHPGARIIYDVKCTRKLVDWVKSHGGVPTISCTGHSLVKAKLRETGAPFAGEMSGHMFFNDGRWPGFDDGMYAGARALEILSRSANPSAVLDALSTAVNTPELQVRMPEGENKKFVAKCQEKANFPDAEDVIKIDGVRVEWKDGFALVRSSNTTPVVVIRLEGDTPEALEEIKKRFGAFLKSVDPKIALPF